MDFSDKLTVETNSIIVPDAIVIVHSGREIGRMSATYDFSNVPLEYHDQVISCLSDHNRRTKIHVMTPLTEDQFKKLVIKRQNLKLGYIGRFFKWIGLT